MTGGDLLRLGDLSMTRLLCSRKKMLIDKRRNGGNVTLSSLTETLRGKEMLIMKRRG